RARPGRCGTVRSRPRCFAPRVPGLRSARRPCPTPCHDGPAGAKLPLTELGIIGGGSGKAIGGRCEHLTPRPEALRGERLKRSPPEAPGRGATKACLDNEP